MGTLLTSLIFGAAIGLIIGIVKGIIKSNNNKNADNTEGDSKECPQCAEKVKSKAKICRFCSYKFSEEEINKEPKEGIKIGILEKEGSNFYFNYKDSLTGANKKYIYLDKFSAERSLIELEKGNEYSRIGLFKISDS